MVWLRALRNCACHALPSGMKAGPGPVRTVPVDVGWLEEAADVRVSPRSFPG